MLYDEELARMRAQMLAKEDEEPPVFDDGARYLGQDPNMMQVGLFGRPKKPAAPPVAPPVNLQRRSILGLTPMPAELPAVIPPAQPKLTPQQMEQAVKPQATFPGPHPDVWSGGPFMSMGDMGDVIKRHLEERTPITAPAVPTEPSTSPLQSLADKALNAPMSRRDVLKRAGQAALQQVVPMPSITDVVPQVMSPLAEVAKAAPAFDKSAILGAVSSFLTDKMVDTSSDLAEELYGRGIWEPEDLNAADATTAWEYAQYGDEDHPEGLATLRDNFNLKKLSEHSGIPIEELKKYISDVELQSLPLSLGNRQERLSAIMEDGRPKEAYRMTALEELGLIDDYIKSSAKELYGTQKSFDEDERWEIANHAVGLAYDDYVRKTINSVEPTAYSFEDEVLLKAGKDWLDESLSSVFDQGLEYSGYGFDDFYERLDDALKPKRAPKPKAEKPKPKATKSKSKDK
jgi:hypothetical protein